MSVVLQKSVFGITWCHALEFSCRRRHVNCTKPTWVIVLNTCGLSLVLVFHVNSSLEKGLTFSWFKTPASGPWHSILAKYIFIHHHTVDEHRGVLLTNSWVWWHKKILSLSHLVEGVVCATWRADAPHGSLWRDRCFQWCCCWIGHVA